MTCHRHEKNGLLVVAVNPGKSTQAATVRANLNLLHIGPTKVVVTDVYRDKPTGIRNGVIAFPPDPIEMRMFRIR